jgi:hypothetical protein
MSMKNQESELKLEKKVVLMIIISIAFMIVFANLFAIADINTVVFINSVVSAFVVTIVLITTIASLFFGVIFPFMITLQIEMDIIFNFAGVIKEVLVRLSTIIRNHRIDESNITKSFRYKLLKFTALLFSAKTQKEIFKPAIAEWDEEIFEALKQNKDANLFMINVRNTYGFIMAMWQKSPLGDLLEYVRKIAS